jgi:excisionase family DNA binding protein
MTQGEHYDWLTVQEVADLLRVTEETVRRWIRANELPVLDLGGPRAGYRIRREDLDRFIADRYGLRGKTAA